MSGKPTSYDEWKLLSDAYDRLGDLNAASRELGLHINTGRSRYYAGKGRWGGIPQNSPIDPGPAVPDGFQVNGVSTLYDSSGEVKAQWVKTTADQIRQQEILHEAIKGFLDEIPKLPARKERPQKYSDELMSVIPWGDPHFGLYCWAAEVGNDFDIEIAKQNLCAAVDYLVSQSPASKRCLIVNLGDFFHADNLDGVTAASGNRLDMDTRLPKVIRVGVTAIRQCIESALDRHDTVEFVTARANHDEVLGMALGVMLSHIYENEPRVVIHDQPTFRHYIQHGKVLIGVTHGHKTKDGNLPGLMAAEKPEEWGATRHRYFYRGHHHQDSVDEFAGCRVEQFRTLAPGDAYAVGHGYLSGRDMKLIVHHSEFGEVARSICGIDMLRSITGA